MIDVVFLLITFFIYNMVIMHNTQVLPMKLVPLADGAELLPRDTHAITINRNGQYLFDRNPVSLAALDVKLAELAAEVESPTVFLAIESEGNVDRGPQFFRLLERVIRSGITNFGIVGTPAEPRPPGPLTVE